MKYEITFESRGRKEGRVLFEKDPIFTTVDENKKEEWRFPAVNHVARDTIKCHECDDVLVEVIKVDEKGNEIADFRNYPVYIRVHKYYGSHVRGTNCKSCWEKRKEDENEQEVERAKKRKARNEKMKAKRAEKVAS